MVVDGERVGRRWWRRSGDLRRRWSGQGDEAGGGESSGGGSGAGGARQRLVGRNGDQVAARPLGRRQVAKEEGLGTENDGERRR